VNAHAQASADAPASYAGVRTLVLGASGFIGSWTVSALVRAGADVVAVARDAPAVHLALARRRTAAHVVVADFTTRGAVTDVVARIRPTVVFNLCGYGVDHGERDAATMHTLNAQLVEELCVALAALPAGAWSGLRLIHAGSALEYGPIQGALEEHATPQPTTDYGRTKLEGTTHVTRAARQTGLRAITARLFTVYGDGEHAGRLLPSLIDAARNGTSLSLTAGTQPRDFTYVEDAVEGLLRLGAVATPASGEVVNVATGRLTTVRAFTETAAAILGITPSHLRFGAVAPAAGEMFHGEVSIARLRALLSWAPSTEISDGIRRTLSSGRTERSAHAT